MIHRVRNKAREFVISSGGVWLPGAYATKAAARWAFAFDYDELRRTQDRVGSRAITTDDLRETARRRRECPST